MPLQQSIHIAAARTVLDFEAARPLFLAYATLLVIDLSSQNFAGELEVMPGQYVPPRGELLLARASNPEPIGCVAVRPITPEGYCEMKRLYVAPAGRGRGVGAALVDAIIGAAMRIGYREMRLDTMPRMDAAHALYRKAGFDPISPYYETPLEETMFLGRALSA